MNPETFESAAEQHRAILELVPFELSISPLDCESLSVMLGFDFAYRGNHNEILAEAVGVAEVDTKLFSVRVPTPPHALSNRV